MELSKNFKKSQDFMGGKFINTRVLFMLFKFVITDCSAKNKGVNYLNDQRDKFSKINNKKVSFVLMSRIPYLIFINKDAIIQSRR